MEHFYNNPLARLCCSREDLAEVVDELKNEDLEQHFGNNKQFQAYVEKLPMQRMEKILSFTNKGKYFKVIIFFIDLNWILLNMLSKAMLLLALIRIFI